jgi:hypothetical protein
MRNGLSVTVFNQSVTVRDSLLPLATNIQNFYAEGNPRAALR